MKVLILIDNLKRGGKERRLVELLHYFQKNTNIEVELILFKEIIEYENIFKISNVNLKIIKRKLKKDLLVWLEIVKYCRKIRPDVIHSWGSMPSVYSITLVLFLRIPLINAMITSGKCKKFGKEWIRAKITFPFSKIILANSNAGLSAF